MVRDATIRTPTGRETIIMETASFLKPSSDPPHARLPKVVG